MAHTPTPEDLDVVEAPVTAAPEAATPARPLAAQDPRFLAGRRWRLAVRFLGLAVFLFGAGLLAWVFWQALAGFQNFTQPDYLAQQLQPAQNEAPERAILAGIVVFGTEFLRVLYLLLLGFLASIVAGKGVQLFMASESVIDEAVVAQIR